MVGHPALINNLGANHVQSMRYNPI